MRLLYTLAALILLNLTALNAQPLTWSWSKSLGGATSSDGFMDIAKDNSGNVYVAGNFTGTRFFGSTSLTATGFSEIYIAKYDVAGNFIWAIKGGANFSAAYTGGVVVTNNDVFVAGTFNNVFTSNGISVNSSGQGDIFMMRLDPATGAASWIEKAGGNLNDKLFDISLAPNGTEFVITGNFTTSASFGPFTLSNGTIGNIDIFLAKYTSAGVCSWAEKAGGNNTDEGYAIVQNSIGTIYLTGYFQDTAYFGGTTSVISYGGYDVFLAKYNASGALAFVRSDGGLNTDFGSSLGIDYQGNVYMSGFISDTAYFGNDTIYDTYAGNIFLAKYNSLGQVQWAIDEGGNFFDVPYAHSTDSLGGTYITGFLTGLADLSGITLNATSDPFIAKYDLNGTLRWATMLFCSNFASGKAILADANGYCYIAGYYYGNMSIGTNNLISPPGDFANYFARLGGGTVGVNEIPQVSFSFYPNPTTDFLNIDVREITDEVYTVEVLTADGKVALSERVAGGLLLANHRIDVSSLAQGNYFLLISSSKGDVSKQFVKH